MADIGFKQRIYPIIRDKIFFSRISGQRAEVVEQLPEEIVPGKVLFDGIMLYDGIEGIEDDIQQMNSMTKDGKWVNLEDYYTDNGAFEEDGIERFTKALKQLMTVEEWEKFVKEHVLDVYGNEEEYTFFVNE